MIEGNTREEICRISASLFARGYVNATAGNISVRMADERQQDFFNAPDFQT